MRHLFLFVLGVSFFLHSSAQAQVNVVRSAQSGPWSAAATWQGGKVPAVGDKVQVRAGHTVVYDVKSDQVIRSLFIVGTLTFAPDRDTQLDVGLIKIEATDSVEEDGFDCSAHIKKGDAHGERPALLVGTPERPIDAKFTAKIRLHFIKGMDPKSCPAIVCCGGRMEYHGAAMNRTWVKLVKHAIPGGEVVEVEGEVVGWRVGDTIIITGTESFKPIWDVEHPPVNSATLRPGKVPPPIRPREFKVSLGKGKPSVSYEMNPPFTEEVRIKAIDGNRITFDRPLKFLHRGEGLYRGEVANLSRNVVVESADPAGVRGHTMYHRHSAGSISYAEFRHLGKEDTLGRYALHFHLCGDTMRGSYVQGASIWDSHNRWITIHGTEYLVVRDCVGYQSVGHGFFLEDGTEVYNVLDRNLAVQAFMGKPLPEQVLPYDPNDGSGFWWSNSLNTFTRNVAVECDRYGFHYEAKPFNFPIPNLHQPIKIPVEVKGKVKPGSMEAKLQDPKNRFDLAFNIRQPDGSRKVVDIRTLPFVRFDDNEAHSNVLWGMGMGTGVDGVGPDHQHPFVIRNLTIWGHNAGFGIEAPSVKVEGMRFGQPETSSYSLWFPVYKEQLWENVVFDKVNRRRLPGESKSGNERGKIRPPEVEVAKLAPVDDLSPITVITYVLPGDNGVLVRGTTSDNGTVKQVIVNGVSARATGQNFSEWVAILPLSKTSPARISAHAEDMAGNVERTVHEVSASRLP